MEALSQLSYGPTRRREKVPQELDFVKKMNGLDNLAGPKTRAERQIS